MTGSIDPTHIAVSYTHLDVYKRQLGGGLEVVDASRMKPDRLRDHAEGFEFVGVDPEGMVL